MRLSGLNCPSLKFLLLSSLLFIVPVPGGLLGPPIQSAIASGNPAFGPLPFLTPSGVANLFVGHRVTDIDAVSHALYHLFEDQDGVWSVPKKMFESHETSVFSDGVFLEQKVTSQGFDVSYFWDSHDTGQGLYVESFNDNTGNWEEPELIVPESMVHDLLNFSDSAEPVRLAWHPVGFRLFQNMSYAFGWYVSVLGDDVDFPKDLRFVTLHSADHSVDSYSVYNKSMISSQYRVNLIELQDGRLGLYSVGYDRVSYLVAGQWTEPMPTGLDCDRWAKACPPPRLQPQDMIVTRGSPDGLPNGYVTSSLSIANLASIPVTIDEVTMPFENREYTFLDMDIKLGAGSTLEGMDLANYDENQLSLWHYDMLADTWTEIDRIAFNASIGLGDSPRAGFWLLRYDDAWRVFWAEGGEIFDIAYDKEEGWGAPRQVTHSEQFTRDDSQEKPSTQSSPVVTDSSDNGEDDGQGVAVPYASASMLLVLVVPVRRLRRQRRYYLA